MHENLENHNCDGKSISLMCCPDASLTRGCQRATAPALTKKVLHFCSPELEYLAFRESGTGRDSFKDPLINLLLVNYANLFLSYDTELEV